MLSTISEIMTRAQYVAIQHSLELPTPEQLFDFQVTTLVEKGFDLPQTDIEQLRKYIPNERQLFIVIPKRTDPINLDDSMSKLVLAQGTPGQNTLRPFQLKDVIDVPTSAHMLLDVKDGRSHRYRLSDESLTSIKNEGRIPYITWHGIVHVALFDYALSEYSLDLVGSRYDLNARTVLSRYAGSARLRSFANERREMNWAVPSAKCIVGA